MAGAKTYLRSGWNILDFLIVVATLVELIFDYYGIYNLNMRMLRTLRILRPLKALKTVPSLRKQVSALISSIRGLINVSIFLGFMYGIFSVIGLQWFAGSTHYTCRVGVAPTERNATWEKYSVFAENSDYSGVCTPEANQLFPGLVTYSRCPPSYNHDSSCGSPLDHGLSLANDSTNANPTTQFGIGNFDDIF